MSSSSNSATARSGGLAPVTISEQEGIRYLHFGTPWVQGAMVIRTPKLLVLEYIQRMMAWMLWRPVEEVAEGHAVQLGLGAGAITRFTHQVLQMQTTVVELNPEVISAGKRWFKLPADDDLLTVLQADAALWMRQRGRARMANVLCVDLYDHEAAAPVLDDEPFYRHCRSLLDTGGVMTVNLFGRDSSFSRSMQCLASVFGEDNLWYLTSTRDGNTIMVATRDAVLPDRPTLLARAGNIEDRYGLPARKWLRLLRPCKLGESDK